MLICLNIASGISIAQDKQSHPQYLPSNTQEVATAVKTVPLAAKKRAFMWRVGSQENQVYLFGTIHVGKKDFYPLPSVVEDALGSAAKVVVEADITKTEGNEDLDKMMFYASPDSLEKNIPKPLMERLKTQLTKMKLPPEGAKTMKPWMVGGFLSVNEFVRLGYDMSYGVDAYLIEAAKKRDKPVLELESQRAQITLLNAMSKAQQEAFLENAIQSLESGSSEKQIKNIVNAWLTGDAQKLEEINTQMSKQNKLAAELDQVLLYNRHDAMVQKIEAYLKSGEPHFVAVGSLHLVGPRGLVALLRNRGHKVEQQSFEQQ
jgi:hypothetical protein